ncbi:MAG: mechanosensitive ion channel family protein, partial [bacterium]
KTSFKFDDYLINAINNPLGYIFYIIAYYLIISIIPLPSKMQIWAVKIFSLFVGMNIAYLVLNFVDIVEIYLKVLAERTDNNLDNQMVGIIKKGMKITVIVISVLIIAQNMGYNVGGLLAGLGIGGLAVALAAQDTLANFFGSITVFADRPFKVGDRIKIEGYDGPVEQIGLRSTRIRTLDGHLVTIPNSVLAKTSVENVSERPTIKKLTKIGLVYNTSAEKMELALKIIKDALGSLENIEPDYKVYFSDFNAYTLDILVIFWVSPADYWLFQSINEKFNLCIKKAFKENGIEMAFPTQTLEVKRLN